VSLAGVPGMLTDRPESTEPDVLSALLRAIRLSGTLQFCIAPSGDWQTGGPGSLASLARRPAEAIPFHVIVEGGCWLRVGDARTDLAAGDVVAFPFRTAHDLGSGDDGREINPLADLPPPPWESVPVLDYGRVPERRVRILCGVLDCDAACFPPVRAVLPPVLLARASEAGPWLAASVAQMAAEVDQPRGGSVSMLERLAEVVFIELLRHEVARARPGAGGWLAALRDPALARCLGAIHADPRRDWSVEALAVEAAVSRSVLCARFAAVLGVSPMRYVRDWRLTLARMALGTTARPIAAVAEEAGYGTEAAFSRAFSRAFGAPPAAWRAGAAALHA
jgi:AraC-like DNA-binding protein